ncbi:MAG: arylamine N-acetyltransferase [Myxococcota bacterium]
MTVDHGLGGWLSERDVVRFLGLLGTPASAPSKAALARLARGVLERVPFQNVWMLARPREPPTLAQIREDMLAGRGGPCGHMNPFLAALLHELGYRVELFSGSMQQPDCHIAVVVTLAGERLWLDVGNAFPYFEPIGFGDDSVRRHPLLEHRLRRVGPNWCIEHRWPDQRWVCNYVLGKEPRSFRSFAPMIHAHYSQPGYGPFLRGLRVVRFSGMGMVALRDHTLRVIDGHHDLTREVPTPELPDVVLAHFPDVELPLGEALRALEVLS